MPDLYVDPTAGSDTNIGSLQQPWKTLTHALGALATATNAPTLVLRPGVYPGRGPIAKAALNIVAPEGGVQIEPAGVHSSWTPVQLGAVGAWHGALSGINVAYQVAWQTAVGQPVHRLPLWATAAPMDTAEKWAAVITADDNPYTRWGLYQHGADLYLIPPADGSWADPNDVRIILGRDPGLTISGPDVHVTCDPGGIWFVCSGEAGIRLDQHAQRAIIDGPRISCTTYGVGVFGGGNATTGWVYGDGHVFRNLLIEDDLSWQAPNEVPDPRQKINWNIIKSPIDFGFKDAAGAPLLVRKPLGSAETVAFFTRGGATNMLVEDCTFSGTFDGVDHWSYDSEFDHNANLNLIVRRCVFRNHGDDSVDISRHSYGVVFDSCTFNNVGTIDSAAPFWGTRTFRNCQGWVIGDQVRPPDANGKRPPGSVWKLGGLGSSDPQGVVHHETCIWWTDTPTTQGVSQDGGTGAKTVRLELIDNVIRVGSIAVNWPYGSSYVVDRGNTWATSGPRPLKTNLPISLTPVAVVDALYVDPKQGDFTLMSVVTDLQAQIAQLNAQLAAAVQQRQDLEQALVAEQQIIAAYAAAQTALLQKAAR